MRARFGVLVVVVGIAVLMLTFGLPTTTARGTSDLTTANAWGHTIVVRPNGSDDTADLQAAFNACVSYGPGCTVQLMKGTYYTAQIAVYGFQGSFVGAGKGQTIIQALPNLAPPNSADNTPTVPFWAAAPTAATGSNPWPVLFTFVNGAFGVSGMTITEPYANPIVAPGWEWPAEYGDTTTTALWAVILVTGEYADAAITQVTVNGAGGDLSIPMGTPSTFNLDSSITYYGMFLPSGWTDPFVDQIPLSGTFSLTNSVIYWSESAFYMENLLDATVVVSSNWVSSSPAPEFVDVSNSQLYFTGNSITNVPYAAGIFGVNSYYKSDLLPSTVYVTGNYFGVNWQGSGPSFWDLGPADFGIASTLNAVIIGNTVVSDNSCECYTAAVSDVLDEFSLASLTVLGNTLYGGGAGVGVFGIDSSGVFVGNGPTAIMGNTILGADYGIWLDGAVNTHVTGNVIKDSVQYGIALTNGASDNSVAYNLVKGSGVDDLFWDETGTGNVWFGDACQTSSPPGLC